ncbi:MAG: efflux RND transporter periplasmic adaptor subunit [bacterium]
MTDAESNKKALLNELKLDRDAPRRTLASGPSKWMVAAALVGGVGFALWAFDLPSSNSALPVKTALARAAYTESATPSVLDATGYIVARRQATVSSKATGKVIEVLIEEGVVVEKDQLLARLDDSIPRAQYELSQSQLDAATAALSELEVQIRQAQLDLGRTEGLAQRNLASQADLDRDGLQVDGLIARLARVRKEITVAQRSLAVQRQLLDDMQIRAPFGGVVVAKAAQPGEMISPVSAGGGFTRTGICTIVDMASLEVEVDVNESYINRVYPDQPVEVVLNAYPADKFAAQVIAIIPAADRNKATVRVRVGLLERDERILPDMGVRVAFLEQATQNTAQEANAQQQGVLIPQAAVAQDAGGQFVYVVISDVAGRRAVRLGAPVGQQARVLTGLQQGERVVAALSSDMLDLLDDGRVVTELN